MRNFFKVYKYLVEIFLRSDGKYLQYKLFYEQKNNIDEK